MIINEDYMSDSFNINSLALELQEQDDEDIKTSMEYVFNKIEGHTYMTTLDFSDVEILSTTGIKGSDLITAKLAEDSQLAYAGSDEFRFNADAVTVSFAGNEDLLNETYNKRLPVYVDGGIRDASLDNEFLYLTSGTLYEKTFGKKFGISGVKGLARDIALSDLCQGLYDRYPINILYRERKGIKKIFGVYSPNNTIENFLTLKTFLSACRSCGLFKVKYWQANQREKMVYIEFNNHQDKSFPYRPGIVLVYSDTGFVAPVIESVWRKQDADVLNFVVQDEFECGSEKEGIIEVLDNIFKLQSEAKTALNLNTVKFNSKNELKSMFAGVNTTGYNVFFKEYWDTLFADIGEKELKAKDFANRIVTDITEDHGLKDTALYNPRSDIRKFAGKIFQAAG